MIDMVDLEDHSSDRPAPDQIAEGEQLYQGVARGDSGNAGSPATGVCAVSFWKCDSSRHRLSTRNFHVHGRASSHESMNDCRAKLQSFM
jgi:hypothetical protein